ncbi:hypothetical protein PGT21_019676 [Puccinia graminis f. sp. tritici]|uniref:Uncharacterized protein n=1 Tax=Puccinia graminis f. sp. tritici TaxID=56615 RepID=A0A5B0NCL3_PUCGR|nr:hypothetical protein PGT21_019676 [Puccinia graminis f. sp. tritici]
MIICEPWFSIFCRVSLSRSTSPKNLPPQNIRIRRHAQYFSGTANGRGAALQDRLFWRPCEALVYAHKKYIDQQPEAGNNINHPDIVRTAMYDAFCGQFSQ